MPLTIHHLNHSQSERIIWLAEELQIPYTYVQHNRDPIFAPQSLKDVNPAGTAPVIIDDPSPLTGTRVFLAESGAIIEYLVAAYGNNKDNNNNGTSPIPRLARTPADGDEYVQYLSWLHFANGSAQPALMRLMLARRMVGTKTTTTGSADGQKDDEVALQQQRQYMLQMGEAKWETVVERYEARLAETGAYLVGSELTAADIMAFFTLTTMRGYCPVRFDGERHRALLAYLARVGGREGYKRAMERCQGAGFVPLLGGEAEVWGFMKR
ncbi:hypothetical protein FQN53_006131 [Emmonsiellopsis sp. PD_33]|nr:hypothetical protein FQN53_006131 [Emmonsiellopsis sp. PD_33]